MFTTREQLDQDLSAQFGENIKHWNLKTRIIWTYQAADGTGKYTNNQNLDYSMTGQIGRPAEKIALSAIQGKHPAIWAAMNQKWGTEAMAGSDASMAIFAKEGTIYKKPYVKGTAIRRVGDEFEVLTFWSFLYDTYLENMDKMRKTSNYTKAVELSGIENPTDEEVARTMGTIFYIGRKDVPDAYLKEYKLDVNYTYGEDTVELESVFTIDGEVTMPLSTMWFVDPASGPLGTDSRGTSAGEYIGGKRKFTLGTDFRNRHTFIIMNNNDVRVRCYAKYKEADGEVKMLRYEKKMDFTEALPLYDYFGLVQPADESSGK